MSDSRSDGCSEIILVLLAFIFLGPIIYSWQLQHEVKTKLRAEAHKIHANMLADTAAISSLEVSNESLSVFTLPPNVKVTPGIKPNTSILVGPPRELADVIAQAIKEYL